MKALLDTSTATLGTKLLARGPSEDTTSMPWQEGHQSRVIKVAVLVPTLPFKLNLARHTWSGAAVGKALSLPHVNWVVEGCHGDAKVRTEILARHKVSTLGISGSP